jgi:hypothetical protein
MLDQLPVIDWHSIEDRISLGVGGVKNMLKTKL